MSLSDAFNFRCTRRRTLAASLLAVLKDASVCCAHGCPGMATHNLENNSSSKMLSSGINPATPHEKAKSLQHVQFKFSQLICKSPKGNGVRSHTSMGMSPERQLPSRCNSSRLASSPSCDGTVSRRRLDVRYSIRSSVHHTPPHCRSDTKYIRRCQSTNSYLRIFYPTFACCSKVYDAHCIMLYLARKRKLFKAEFLQQNQSTSLR